jgi:hypothetical protein
LKWAVIYMWGFHFLLFLRVFNLILELFQQCDIFFKFYYWLHFNIYMKSISFSTFLWKHITEIEPSELKPNVDMHGIDIKELFLGCYIQYRNTSYFKHILLFNKKQLDRTQVSQLRNVFLRVCFRHYQM